MRIIAYISAWVLFIFAWVMLINTMVQSWFFSLREEMTMVGGGIAMISFFLTAVAAKIEKSV
jgi:hypothetical protein